MFVVSLKANRKRVLLLLLLLAVIFTALYLTRGVKVPTLSDGGISLKASDAAERIAFLSQFGWEIDEDPVRVEEILIPAEFNETYAAYNELQRAQDFDLQKYAGKTAKQWTYAVRNYPGHTAQTEPVYANLIVYDGAVIGGDVSAAVRGGFRQGFDFPETTTHKTEKTANP